MKRKSRAFRVKRGGEMSKRPTGNVSAAYGGNVRPAGSAGKFMRTLGGMAVRSAVKGVGRYALRRGGAKLAEMGMPADEVVAKLEARRRNNYSRID